MIPSVVSYGKTEFTMQDILNSLEHEVEYVREVLEKFYGDQKDKYFTGLCDEASEMLIARLQRLNRFVTHWKILGVHKIHGELIHSPIIESKYWWYQHTIVTATIAFHGKRYIIYIDPTCQQFQEILENIPDYYIGTDFPWWMLPDSKNVAFSPITKNNRFLYKMIRFFQMNVWGTISDVIHMFYREDDDLYGQE